MSDLSSNAARLYLRAEPNLKNVSQLSPLVIRLTLGVVFISSGWGKLNDLEQVTEFFTELGIVAPRLNALVVAATEFFGGIALSVGFATRLVALPLAMTMVVAILTALLPDVSGIVELIALGEFAYLVMFLSLVSSGPGRWSVDHLIVQRVFIRSDERATRAIAPAIVS